MLYKANAALLIFILFLLLVMVVDFVHKGDNKDGNAVINTVLTIDPHQTISSFLKKNMQVKQFVSPIQPGASGSYTFSPVSELVVNSANLDAPLVLVSINERHGSVVVFSNKNTKDYIDGTDLRIDMIVFRPAASNNHVSALPGILTPILTSINSHSRCSIERIRGGRYFELLLRNDGRNSDEAIYELDARYPEKSFSGHAYFKCSDTSVSVSIYDSHQYRELVRVHKKKNIGKPNRTVDVTINVSTWQRQLKYFRQLKSWGIE